ncbi:MAG TPA: ice-binding family protein [Candidatus Saccharimonadales bacterium]|nr:ice-binding family protein [Candidatus Saccharimonadales bacterium]
MFKRSTMIPLVLGATVMFAAAWPVSAFAATSPRLGTALNFTVLGGSTITNTGPTVVTGELGLHPGTALTGFPPGVVTGTKHLTDGAALQAKDDLVTAYSDAANAPTTANLTGENLGGKHLNPGVYRFSSSAQLTGSLTLSGRGIFIFKIGSTLTTASSAVVRLTNGAQACQVFWQVGSSATLGTATRFQGNLMALTSITLTTGANVPAGRVLARNGAVTLHSNDIARPAGTCLTAAVSTPGTGTPETGAVGSILPGVGLAMVFGGVATVAIGVRRARPRRGASR